MELISAPPAVAEKLRSSMERPWSLPASSRSFQRSQRSWPAGQTKPPTVALRSVRLEEALPSRLVPVLVLAKVGLVKFSAETAVPANALMFVGALDVIA